MGRWCLGAGLTVLAGCHTADDVVAGGDAGTGRPSALGSTAARASTASPLVIEIEDLLEQAVADRVFPGAVCLIRQDGVDLCRLAVGRETYADDARAVEVEHLFDMASLTKVCATTPVVLRLVARGTLTLETRVADLLPFFAGEGKGAVTIRHLLTHSSGLPAWRKFYEQGLVGKAAVVRAAAGEPLEARPGERTRYSDLGLILLMACVEQAAGADFDAVVQREVFDPLGMPSARFNTTGRGLPWCVPTEVSQFHGKLLDGVVHDENAFVMGGASGHAGLFAAADDVARLAEAFLRGGTDEGGDPWLPQALVANATRRQNLTANSSRCLGWDSPRAGSWAGAAVPEGLFAHTGFTGTSVWCDPATATCVVLLTNRVHPTRKEKRHTAVRRRLHDLVQRHLAGR